MKFIQKNTHDYTIILISHNEDNVPHRTEVPVLKFGPSHITSVALYGLEPM